MTFVRLLAFSLALFFLSPAAHAGEKDGYQRVMDSGVLKCGYSIWPGLLEMDPNTKQLSGTFYDYLNELAKTMEIKVEWVAELPYSDIPQALNDNKIDAHCSGAWTNPIRGKFADIVTPISYQYVGAFVRTGDKRFDNKLGILNDPKYKISVIDGESAATIAATSFPKATIISNPQGTEGTQMLLDVIEGKADAAFTEMGMLEKVMKTNPGKVQAVKTPYPLQVYGNSIWVKKGDVRLKNTLDIATMQLINGGTIAQILKKHETMKGQFLYPRPTYLPAE